MFDCRFCYDVIEWVVCSVRAVQFLMVCYVAVAGAFCFGCCDGCLGVVCILGLDE